MIYRVDLHVHTLRGSADPALCLSELVRAARQAGLDAIAITDTDYCTPVPIELRGVVLIPGCEVSTLGGSILGVFLERPLDFVRLRQHGLPTADETVLEIHRCGGLAILAHPFAQTDANPALFPIRPDAVETACASVVPPNSAAGQRASSGGPRSTSAPAWAAATPAPPESWVRFTRRSPAPACPALF